MCTRSMDTASAGRALLCLSVILIATEVSSKLCCDQECTKPLSYGRTKDRYITQEDQHLSFPNAAIVTIFTKQAGHDSSSGELWFAEIQGRRGFVPASYVDELHTLCEAKSVGKEEEVHDHEEILHTPEATVLPIPSDSSDSIDRQETDQHNIVGDNTRQQTVNHQEDIVPPVITEEEKVQINWVDSPSEVDHSDYDERVSNDGHQQNDQAQQFSKEEIYRDMANSEHVNQETQSPQFEPPSQSVTYSSDSVSPQQTQEPVSSDDGSNSNNVWTEVHNERHENQGNGDEADNQDQFMSSHFTEMEDKQREDGGSFSEAESQSIPSSRHGNELESDHIPQKPSQSENTGNENEMYEENFQQEHVNSWNDEISPPPVHYETGREIPRLQEGNSGRDMLRPEQDIDDREILQLNDDAEGYRKHISEPKITQHDSNSQGSLNPGQYEAGNEQISQPNSNTFDSVEEQNTEHENTGSEGIPEPGYYNADYGNEKSLPQNGDAINEEKYEHKQEFVSGPGQDNNRHSEGYGTTNEPVQEDMYTDTIQGFVPPTPDPYVSSQEELAKQTLVDLRSGRSAYAKGLGDGSVQLTLEDGSRRIVDYDYFTEDVIERFDYDYDAGNEEEDEEEDEDEYEEAEEPTILSAVDKDEEIGTEGYPSLDTATAQEADLTTPTPTLTTASQTIHNYLHVDALRQRYQKGNQEVTSEIELQSEPTPESVTETVVLDTELNEMASSSYEIFDHSVQDSIDQVTSPYHDHMVSTNLPSDYEQEHVTKQQQEKTSSDVPIVHSEVTGEEQISTLFVPDKSLTEAESTVSEDYSTVIDLQPEQTNPVSPQDRHYQATPLPDVDQGLYHEPSEKEQTIPLPSLELPSEEYDRQEPTANFDTFNTEASVLDSSSSFVNLVALYSPGLAALINNQVTELGLIGVITSALCLLFPLCCSCCHFWRDSRKKALAISKHRASRKRLEEQIEKLKADKKGISSERLNLEQRHENVASELEQMKLEMNSISVAKQSIEESYNIVCGELQTAKQNLNQLQSDFGSTQAQLSTLTDEKAASLQQMAIYQSKIVECVQKVQELEAAKEQLEQDSFSLNTRYHSLQTAHDQVMQELADSTTKNAELEARVSELQEEICALQKIKSESTQEIQTLQNCLNQLVANSSKEADHQDDVDSDAQTMHSADVLFKIQSMLDTTKVQEELQKVREERNKAVEALMKQTELVKDLQEKNCSLREHVADIESQFSECTEDFGKLKEKHKTLTEYFEQKEHNLHRMLGAEEAVRQAVETREAQVKEKAQSLEQTEARHREELRQLRSEMFEIEKSLMSQVHTCQKRAEDAIAEQRRLEQECKAFKLERDDLRKRVGGRSASPLGGSSGHHSLVARPPSVPYLPRTSSPGVVDSEAEHVTSLLSQTDPLPNSQSQPSIQNPGPAEPIPFFPRSDPRVVPPFQPPLQHPHPNPRPRYPVPPPGRRLVRGYPPFERRPPRPGVYGPPPPRFYRDVRERAPERRRPLSNPPPGAYDPHLTNNPHDREAGFVPVVPVVPEPSVNEQSTLGNRVPDQTL